MLTMQPFLDGEEPIMGIMKAFDKFHSFSGLKPERSKYETLEL